MADLNTLAQINIDGRQYGAYYEIGFNIADCGFVSLEEIIQYLLDNSGDGPSSSGASLFEYEAAPIAAGIDIGCFVTATVQGATYARTGGASQNTEGILTLPTGGILRGLSIHFTKAQAPGNTFYLNLDRLGTNLPVNGSYDSLRPVMATVASKPDNLSEADPVTNFVHAGTPLFVQTVAIEDNGTRVRQRIKIQNYNQQVGAGASILTLIFP